MDVRSGNSEAFLEVFFVPDQAVELAGNRAHDLLATGISTHAGPEFGAVVQVERGHGTGGLGCVHPFDDQGSGGFAKRGENAARVEPANTGTEDAGPVEVARLEECAGFVGTVIEHNRGTHTVALVGVDGGDVWTTHAVVLKVLVERGDTHLANPALDQFADRVIDHGCGHTGVQAEAVGEVGRDVVFATRDVDIERTGLAEGDDTGVETCDKCAE